MSTNPNKVAIVDAKKAPASPIWSSMVVSGHLIFLSGAIGDHQDGKLIEGTIQDRTKRAFGNVADRLSLLGLGLEDVVSCTIYLSRYKEDFADMNVAYQELFSEGGIAKPCRTCVGVADLPAGTDIEVSCIAAKRN